MNIEHPICIEVAQAGFPNLAQSTVRWLTERDARRKHTVEQLAQIRRNESIWALWGVLEKLTKTRLNEKRGADNGGLHG